MHRESVVPVDVVAVRDSPTLVSVADVPDGVDDLAAATQQAVNLGHQLLELRGAERHTEQHVGEDGVKGKAIERQWRAHVVGQGAQVPVALGTCGVFELLQCLGGEVECRYRQASLEQSDRVTALPTAQFQYAPRAGF